MCERVSLGGAWRLSPASSLCRWLTLTLWLIRLALLQLCHSGALHADNRPARRQADTSLKLTFTSYTWKHVPKRYSPLTEKAAGSSKETLLIFWQWNPHSDINRGTQASLCRISTITVSESSKTWQGSWWSQTNDFLQFYSKRAVVLFSATRWSCELQKDNQ